MPRPIAASSVTLAPSPRLTDAQVDEQLNQWLLDNYRPNSAWALVNAATAKTPNDPTDERQMPAATVADLVCALTIAAMLGIAAWCLMQQSGGMA